MIGSGWLFGPENAVHRGFPIGRILTVTETMPSTESDAPP